MISIVELLMYCQFFLILVLEQYCIEKSNQLRTKSYQVSLESMYIPDIHSVENSPVVSIKKETPIVQISNIEGTEAEELFSALQQELGGLEMDEVAPMENDNFYEIEPAVAIYQDEDTFNGSLLINELNILEQVVDEEPMVNEEDCLSLDDLMEFEEPEISVGYRQFATAKIADNLTGEQQWIVSVLGMEGPYIHVSDGRRVWLDLGEKVHLIHPNDILSVEVNRKEDGKIEVIRTIKIEEASYVNEDYLIPDEEYFINKDKRAVC